MSKNLSVGSKEALFLDGKRITEYEYDFFHETSNEIILYSDFKVVIYSKETGEKLFEYDQGSGVENWAGLFNKCLVINTGDGYLIVKSDGSSKSNTVFDKFDLIHFGDDIFFKVSIKGKEGLYDSEVRQIIPLEYSCISKVACAEDLIIVHNDNKRGLYNLNGDLIFPAIYNKINILQNCIEVYNEDADERSIYTRDGKTKILSGHNWFYAIYNIYGMIAINNQSKSTYSLYSEDGTPILEEYDYIEVGDIRADHAIIARKNWKYGLFDLSGNELLPCVYVNIKFGGMRRYEGGTVSIVDDEGNLGVYSIKSGKIVVPPKKYSQIMSYEKGICEMVTEENQHGYYITKEDKFVEAEDINITKTGLYEFLHDGTWELYN